MKRIGLGVLLVIAFATPVFAQPTSTPTNTPTIGPLDCCNCSGVCAAPVGNSCGGSCTVVYGAACVSGGCVTHTPTKTATPTRTATNTRTFTSTPTSTNTPAPTATFTSTFPIAPTPFATGAPAAAITGAGEWRSVSFSSQNTRLEIVPAVPKHRNQIYFLQVVADAATNVTVTAGGVDIVFNFITANLNVAQRTTFALPLATGIAAVASVKQSGTANVTVTVGSAVP